MHIKQPRLARIPTHRTRRLRLSDLSPCTDYPSLVRSLLLFYPLIKHSPRFIATSCRSATGKICVKEIPYVVAAREPLLRQFIRVELLRWIVREQTRPTNTIVRIGRRTLSIRIGLESYNDVAWNGETQRSPFRTQIRRR